MAVDYTTTELLAGAKRRGMLPSTDETLSSADYLAFMSEEMQSYVAPLLISVREDYLAADYNVALTSTLTTAGTPPRAIGDKLKQVLVADAGGTYHPIREIVSGEASTFAPTGTPVAYYLRDSTVVFVPAPSSDTDVRLQYYRRPNRLVLPAACAVISSLDVARDTITTVATIPSTIATTVVLDIISHAPPFKWTQIDAVATTGTTGTTINLTAALPTGVVAGNYVCLAGESPVAQVPYELYPLLQQLTALAAQEALGDKSAEVLAKARDLMVRRALTTLTPRVEGSRTYIVNRNGPGFGRR